ncbi:relaxase [Pseudomonas veronii 1YdBTEX2]|uniref:Relaxase n=1 Tax=Pseudomonas veronii 1YdBTEX2 TaxID=1295141 RepID=A0A1D3JSE1_PSEVE|nr:relaxase/mobilization nuclease domain-containing protein [Pseudomonas veronii]SBW79000.1 relaxase [Pseudomonas veronii 1YdBTEX2]
MINSMETRTGGYTNGVANSADYLLKLNPQGDAIDCSIERLEGETDHAYVMRIEKVFESARVHNQKNLYQFNSLSLHPSEANKFTDAQMIEMAKEVYLRNGVKNSSNENRHYMFVVERNTKHHHVHAMIHLTDLETKKVNNKMIDYNPIIKKLELKYGLYNEHRKPKDEDEYKKTFKKELKTILDNALTASEFLMLANGAGFDIHHSAKDAYSMTKDGQTFKASDLAVSYKTLKAALGDDPEFAATLASLHTEKPGNDGFGSIGGDFHDEQSIITEKRIKKSNRVLDTRFDTPDGHDFFYKNSNNKAFKYDALLGKATFSTSNPVAIKAGLQKLTEKGKPQTLHLNGNDDFKRNAWLEFHMMKLDQKGYSLKGFKPTDEDKEKLEKMKLENSAFKKPIEENNIKALPTKKIPEKPTGAEVADGVKTVGMAAAGKVVDVAAGVLEGALNKLTDMSDGSATDQLAALNMMKDLIEESERKEEKKRKPVGIKLMPQ